MENTYQDHRLNRLWIVVAILFFIILTPNIRIPRIPSIRMEQFAVFGIILLWISAIAKGKKVKVYLSSFTLLLGLFSLVVIGSILVGSMQGITVQLNDFFELYKVVVYLGVYTVVGTYIKNEQDQLKLLKTLNLLIVISGFVAFTQYVNLLGLNEYYIPIIAPTQFTTLVAGYATPRVIGLTSNPNTYGAMTGIGVILSLYLLLKEKKKRYSFFFLINFIACLMTLSRSGFVLMGVGSAMIVLLHFKQTIISMGKLFKGVIDLKGLKVLVVAAVLIVGFVVGIIWFLPEAFTWRLLEGANLATSRGWQARLSNWQENIQLFLISPVFGIGPAKAIEYQFAADNEWLLMLRQYGLFGTFYFMLMFFLPIILKGGKRESRKHVQFYKAMVVAVALFMIPAAVFHSFQLMSMITALMAIIFWKEEDFKYIA